MMNQQPMRVMMYTLVTAPTRKQFNVAVQGSLNDAWQPWGDPFTWENFACQAMVKYERKER